MENIVRRTSPKPGKRCAFTGYRPQKLPFGFNENAAGCSALKKRLSDAIRSLIDEGYTHFISGGALGVDMFAAEAVLQLRKEFPWIVLEMVSPFDAQPDRWNDAYKARHADLFNRADIVTVISHAYTQSCLSRRNHYLVDNADLMLAVFDGIPGGTAGTVAYAVAEHVPVRYVPVTEDAC